MAGRIHELIQQHFAHWEGAPRDDVERAYKDYVEQLSRSTDRQAFDLATLRFVATLRNGHTQFFDDRADDRALKFRLLEVENQWVVVSSQTSSLPRGTIVSTIGGRPMADVVRDLSPSSQRRTIVSRERWYSITRCFFPSESRLDSTRARSW